MPAQLVSGIQQIGIGVEDVNRSWRWHHRWLGMDIRIFDETAPARYMAPFTGGRVWERHAALAFNLRGGGGLEIWQYADRAPQPPSFQIMPGDLGIYACKIKCPDVVKTHALYRQGGLQPGPIVKCPGGHPTFFVSDPAGNTFQCVEAADWFGSQGKLSGGVAGAILGSSDPDRAMQFYSAILGYDQVLYDVEGTFPDLAALPGGGHRMRRLLLTHRADRKGPFSRLLGRSAIELIQVLDRQPRRIFESRWWGDLGFIHLAFDIRNMAALRQACADRGFPFAIDSACGDNDRAFQMGQAAGHFAYVVDPDGTWIEFIETTRLPLLGKWGLPLNLVRRDPEKPLPDLLLKALRLLRVKDI